MRRWLWGLVLAICVTVGGGTTAHALEAVSRNSYVLSKQEVHRGDLAVNSQTVVIDGTVQGDVYAFTQHLEVRGKVTGDVIAFAQETVVSGEVDGDVRAISQSVTLTGSVSRNVSALAQVLDVEQQGTVGGSILSCAESFVVMGNVNGEANGFVREARIGGTIAQGVSHLTAERVNVLPSAVIKGDFTYRSPQRAHIAPGAQLQGEEHYLPAPLKPDRTTRVFPWLGWAISLVCTLILWLLIRYLLPSAVLSTHRMLDQHPVVHAGKGAIALILSSLAALLLALTIVGIAIALALAISTGILLYVSPIFIGSWAGAGLTGRLGWHPLLAEGTGVVGLWLAMRIPFIGWLITLAVWFLFLGVVIAAIQRTRRPAL